MRSIAIGRVSLSAIESRLDFKCVSRRTERMNIPPMDEDLKQLLSTFNAHGVKYLVIGGYAVWIYAQPRVTKDLDVFIEVSEANARAIYQALAQFGAPLRGLSEKISVAALLYFE